MNFTDRYTVIMASDVRRDGMYLELWEHRPDAVNRELVMNIFYSDKDGTFETEKFHQNIPTDVETWFTNEAHRRLPPMD